MSAEEVLQELASESANGLSQIDAAHRLNRYGPNRLAENRLGLPGMYCYRNSRALLFW